MEWEERVWHPEAKGVWHPMAEGAMIWVTECIHYKLRRLVNIEHIYLNINKILLFMNPLHVEINDFSKDLITILADVHYKLFLKVFLIHSSINANFITFLHSHSPLIARNIHKVKCLTFFLLFPPNFPIFPWFFRQAAT